VTEALPSTVGKTGEPYIDHESGSAWTDLAGWQKEDPEIGPIVRLRMNANAKPSLSSVQFSIPPPLHPQYFYANLDKLRDPYFQKVGYVPATPTPVAPPVLITDKEVSPSGRTDVLVIFKDDACDSDTMLIIVGL